MLLWAVRWAIPSERVDLVLNHPRGRTMRVSRMGRGRWVRCGFPLSSP